MRYAKILISMAALLVGACAGCQKPPPGPGPQPPTDGGFDPDAPLVDGGAVPEATPEVDAGQADSGPALDAAPDAPASPCERYCSRFAALGCPEAKDYGSCLAQCSRIVAHPDIATLDLDAGKCSTRRMP
jgi:hypothetical protein